MSKLEAVILNLGNVLVFHDNAKLFVEVAALFGTSVESLRARLEGSGVWDRANRGRLKGDMLAQELASRLGVPVPNAADFLRAWTCHFTLNEPMIRLTRSLAGKVKLVLLSNTHDLHVDFLVPQLPVLKAFEGLVLSCEEGFVKPEPQLYARALEVAQVPADRAVFFDDIESYAEGARRAGMHAHVFRDAADVPGQLAALGLRPGA